MKNIFFDTANKTWKVKIKNATTSKWANRTIAKGEWAVMPPEYIVLAAEILKSKAPIAPIAQTPKSKNQLADFFDSFMVGYKRKPNTKARVRVILKQFMGFCGQNNINTIKEIDYLVIHN